MCGCEGDTELLRRGLCVVCWGGEMSRWCKLMNYCLKNTVRERRSDGIHGCGVAMSSSMTKGMDRPIEGYRMGRGSYLQNVHSLLYLKRHESTARCFIKSINLMQVFLVLVSPLND